jgi:hypothetical protein
MTGVRVDGTEEPSRRYGGAHQPGRGQHPTAGTEGETRTPLDLPAPPPVATVTVLPFAGGVERVDVPGDPVVGLR